MTEDEFKTRLDRRIEERYRQAMGSDEDLFIDHSHDLPWWAKVLCAFGISICLWWLIWYAVIQL